MLKTERIQQTASGTWSASGTINVDLDRIGLATRYEVVFQITPSATALNANQPDAFWRPFRSLTFQMGEQVYFYLPDEAGGHGGTLLHYLNVLDGLGRGYIHQLIVAPSQTFYTPRLVFHAGVRPKKSNGVDNPYDLTGFLPAGVLSSPQIKWLTTANTVMDDTITLSSGAIYITASRVMGTTQEIQAEMQNQGVAELLAMVPGATGFIPAWAGEVQSPTATASNYGLVLDAQLDGWLKRVTFLAQDATATRPVRADDELTQIRFYVPEESLTLVQLNTEVLAAALPDGDFLRDDDGAVTTAGFLGGNPAPGGIYPFDLRPDGRDPLSQVLGFDTRGRKTGYARFGQTLGTNASGDDILVLTERMKAYQGALSND